MKYINFIVGVLFVGLAAAGAALPVLPTVPFLLLASFFFARSSERAENWYHSTKVYKKYMKDFDQDRAMTLKTKVSILLFASSMLIIAFVKMNNIYGRAVIIGLIIFKYYYFIFRIKTIKPEESSRAIEKRKLERAE